MTMKSFDLSCFDLLVYLSEDYFLSFIFLVALLSGDIVQMLVTVTAMMRESSILSMVTGSR